MPLKASKVWRCVNCDKKISAGDKFNVVAGEMMCIECTTPKAKVILTRRREGQRDDS